jgi:hypothetical protein
MRQLIMSPENTHGFYLLPIRLPEISSPREAQSMINAHLNKRAEAIKLFTGSWASEDSVVVMPTDVIRTATAAAHRQGQLVIAHPSNTAGARAAVDGGWIF